MFQYETAFDCNIGWLTEAEQQALRRKRVAIAGCGGVGGAHLLTLVRLGIGAFTLADHDTFELANFNRQVGATMATLNQPKAAVMARMARDINPELDLRILDDGVTPENLDAFLEDADLLVDGFDFHALDIRRLAFAAAHTRGIPAITAGPIGLSTAYVIFLPDYMSFEQYFGMSECDDPALAPAARQAAMEQHFLHGLVPNPIFRSYLAAPERFALEQRRAPSIGASCQLCAGVVGITAIKLLTGRGEVKPAPWHHHFDPYCNVYVCERLEGGG